MATPAMALIRHEVSCGDEIWIATALLTRERPADPDHSVEDIMARAAQENIHGSVRKGLEGYARVHCCANKPPSPSALKMLYATGRNRRRLYRPSDDHHPGRTGRSMPALHDIPEQYHELVEWWHTQLASLPPVEKPPVKSFLKAMEELRQAGKGTWKGIDADSYVRELREGLGLSRIFLDTNIFIYFYEDAGSLSALTRSLLERLDQRGDQIVTSTLTLGELLVHPLRTGNEKLATLYEQVLQPPSIEIIPFDRSCSSAFARIRLDKSIKPPDAIQLACAATARCDLFITNDSRLTGKIVPGLQFIAAIDKVPV